MRFRRTVLPAIAMAGAAAFVLAGCASGGSEGTAGGGSTEGFPVSIETAFGTTEIDAKPENVAAVAWGNQDVALALGVVPVGMPFITYADDNGDGILPWAQDALDELGGETPVLYDEVDGINFEQVADTAPDVVLAANSGLSDEDYTTLSEIAPTIAYPSIPWFTTWREATTMNGAALGLADEADELVTETEQTIADAAAAHPELAGKTFAYLWVDPSDTSTNYVYLSGDARVSFLHELGLEDSEGVKQLATENDGAFFATVSAENFDILADADIIINYGGAGTLEAMQADPLLGALPAVQNGAVAIIDESQPMASAFSTPTVLSIAWGLDDYSALLAAAAAKVQ
ncbi:iron-siderophore ABC transporter substrate-binding protein [Herbiconiux sp. L3-i23]|uniref:iron-siderophore ABC transporter substrate-binding protein n=1 Tax=Herbiconiux sp. L3-i23 TaxID=2905871 RepID=UPI00204D530E|nr:iron-siderophore ABC transporter substrate-binding protein [Herbiconiux sp. L3-i23]BDI22260.1 periplasmic binding protein [Herbiconiux sp. L3-i23]